MVDSPASAPYALKSVPVWAVGLFRCPQVVKWVMGLPAYQDFSSSTIHEKLGGSLLLVEDPGGRPPRQSVELLGRGQSSEGKA